MYNVIKKREYLIRGALYFCIIAAVYLMFFHQLMTSDYMPRFREPVMFPDIKIYIPAGRFMNYIISWIYYILARINVTHYENIFVLQIAGIIMYSITGVIIYTIFAPYCEKLQKPYLLDLMILISFINPLMVETYVYGALDFGLGILIAVAGAKLIYKKKYVWGVIVGFLAVSTYQSNIIIMFIICVTAVFLENIQEDFMLLIKREVTAGTLCLLSAISNIALQKILLMLSGGHAVKSVELPSDYHEKISVISVRIQDFYINMYGMLPRFFLLGFLLIVIVVGFIVILKKNSYKAFIWVLMEVVLLIAPFSFGLITSIWYPQRVMLPVFFAIAVLLISILPYIGDNIHIRRIFISAFAVFFIVNLLYTQTCVLDCFLGQALDHNEAKCIQDEIEEYQNDTGNEIEFIFVKNRPAAMYYYDGIQLIHYSYATYNHRIMYDAWSRVEYLNYINDTYYNFEEMTDEDFERYFGGKYSLWNCFNPSEQLYFDGNTMYWAVY